MLLQNSNFGCRLCLKLRTSNPRSEKVKQMASFLIVNGPFSLFFFFYLIQGSLERLREKREQIWAVLRKLLNLFLENDEKSL